MLPVMANRSVNVSLSIDLESDPISGFMSGDVDQEPRRFSGWVELAGAIEDVRIRRAGGAGAETLGFVPGANGAARS
jgi:hypothetical protein